MDDRLATTFNQMARHPAGTLPRKLPGRAQLVGSYRMCNHPQVTHAALLAAHRARCLEQLRGHPGKLLLLHDTTVLDYSGLDVEGLGQIGDGHGRGLYAHHSLAVLPESRQVVGLLSQILHRRGQTPPGETKAQRQARPDRESRLWKQAVADLPALPPGVVATDVSDRGSDLTEYLAYELQAERLFIVRSQHNRHRVDAAGVPQPQKLHDYLRSLPAQGEYQVQAPCPTGGRRAATVALAGARVYLRPPRQARGEHGREPLAGWGVIAREVAPPAGVAPLEWILLTNRPGTDLAAAREVVEDYACRWLIEDYHKALKTGCGIETLQLTTRHGLANAIALLSVLGVHVLRLRSLARDPARAAQPAPHHEEPLKVQLAARAAGHPRWQAMTVAEFCLAVARLGGYQRNPRKHPPGWQVLWRGYTRLEDMCAGVRLLGERCVQT